MQLTSADDTGVYTMPTGTQTIVGLTSIGNLEKLTFGASHATDSYLQWDNVGSKLDIYSGGDIYFYANSNFNTNTSGLNVPTGKKFQINGTSILRTPSSAGTTKATWDADSVYGASRAAISAYVLANSGSLTDISSNIYLNATKKFYFGSSTGSTYGHIMLNGGSPYMIDWETSNSAYKFLTLNNTSGEVRLMVTSSTGVGVSQTDATSQTINGDFYVRADGAGTYEFQVDNANGNTTVNGYVNAVGGYKDNGSVGVDGTFTTSTKTITVSGGIITGIADIPGPEPSPSPSGPSVDWQQIANDWQNGINCTERIIEYSPDWKQMRLVFKTYMKGILVEKNCGEWKRVGLLHKILIHE